MTIDVESVGESFSWDTFENGKPYLGTYKQEIPGKVKMMTQALDLKDWVKIDSTYPSQQAEKERLLEEGYKDKVFVTNPDESTTLAKQELIETLAAYLIEMFPDKFEGRQDAIYNKMLEEEISIKPDDTDPLLKCGRLTQDDWCIMEYSDEDDAYRLTAGVVFFPMRWDLNDKWNRPMPGIHGPVQGYQNHLVKNVNNLFKNMPPTAPVKRGNWAIFNDLEGPLDLYTPTGHESRNEVNTDFTYHGEASGKEVVFRAEYQTLRKLEKSRAIVFGIRTYQFYLEDFKTFPREDSEMLVKAIENIHPDFIKYKGSEFWQDATLQYLRHDVLGYPLRRNSGCGDEPAVLTESLFKPQHLIASVAVVTMGVAAMFLYGRAK